MFLRFSKFALVAMAILFSTKITYFSVGNLAKGNGVFGGGFVFQIRDLLLDLSFRQILLLENLCEMVPVIISSLGNKKYLFIGRVSPL